MKAAVVTLSDKGFRNEREDKSGELVQMMLKEAGYEVAEYRLLPDEQTQIETVLKELSDEKEMDLILTTGGTGFSQRDCYTGSNDECSYPKCAGDCRSNAVCVTGYYPQSDVEPRGIGDSKSDTDH